MAEDEAKMRELKTKVGKLVQQKFGGNLRKAFEYYAALGEYGAMVKREEVRRLLQDAAVGNYLERTLWADYVMLKLDNDGDSAISWEEFDAGINLRKS